MYGTFLNVLAILAGGIVGLTVARGLSPANESRLKIALALLTIYAGFSMIWNSLHGSFGNQLKQFTIAFLALIFGNVIGKTLRMQKSLNRLGQYAKKQITTSNPASPHRPAEGFITCSLLFCVGPMALLGAMEDGLTGTFRTLAIKSVMDGLATMAFAKTFGWGVLLSAIPVLAYQGTITLAARALEPFLRNQALLDSIHITGGFLILTITLVILELRKVPLADYLPSLIVAPVLAWIWR